MNLYANVNKNLKESDLNEIALTLTNDHSVSLAPSNIVVLANGGKKEQEEYLEKLLRGSISAEDVAKRLNDNQFPKNGAKRIFYTWTPVKTEHDITRTTYNPFINKKTDIQYKNHSTVESTDDDGNHRILDVYTN